MYVTRYTHQQQQYLHCIVTRDEVRLIKRHSKPRKKFHDMESPIVSPNKEIQSEIIIEEGRGKCLCNR